jgi:methylthioxylose transferase
MIVDSKRKIDLVLGVAALLVLGFLAAVHSGDLPLGVEHEWQWPRLRGEPAITSLLIAAAGVVAYGGFSALGYRALGVPSRIGPLRETNWVVGLTAFAVALQIFIPMGAPDNYGLTKWAYVHYLRGATGYYEIAKTQAGADPWKFLADYPKWIETQAADHIGTHPPGLIAMYSGLLALLDRQDAAVDFLNTAMPPSVSSGFRQLEGMHSTTIPRTDRAAIYLASLITLLACAGTVAPLYLLARESLPPQFAWVAAAFWPLVPALNLFQPLADTAYPLLSATALAAAAWSARLRGTPGLSTWAPAMLAIASGAVMAFGMMFTLALLPIGLIVALVVLATRSISWAHRLQVLAWIGVGFVAVVALAWLATGADPVVIWRWNLRHNARFYEGGRRSYLIWLFINPVELAIAAGLPMVVWCLTGVIADRRCVPRAAWSTLIVLTITNLAGRNMGEVARLWMIFLPPLFTAAGVGLARLGGGTQAVFVTVVLTGLQTVGLQCMVQFVYPF